MQTTSSTGGFDLKLNYHYFLLHCLKNIPGWQRREVFAYLWL